MARLQLPALPSMPDRVSQAVVDALLAVAAYVSNVELLDGRLVRGTLGADGRLSDGIAFSAGGTTTLDHGLGRAWRGWIVARTYGGSGLAPARLAEATSPADSARQLSLTATDACRVWIWVY